MEKPNGFLSREPDSVGLQKDIISAKLYKDMESWVSPHMCSLGMKQVQIST